MCGGLHCYTRMTYSAIKISYYLDLHVLPCMLLLLVFVLDISYKGTALSMCKQFTTMIDQSAFIICIIDTIRHGCDTWLNRMYTCVFHRKYIVRH